MPALFGQKAVLFAERIHLCVGGFALMFPWCCSISLPLHLHLRQSLSPSQTLKLLVASLLPSRKANDTSCTSVDVSAHLTL